MVKKMASPRTELSPQDKGKILAYMENFNATQIAKKMGHDLLQYADLLTNTRIQEVLKIYHDQDGHLLSMLLKKMHL